MGAARKLKQDDVAASLGAFLGVTASAKGMAANRRVEVFCKKG